MAAPKGNKFAIGNSGKSKKFETSEQLQEAINEYFDFCDKNTVKIFNKKDNCLVDIPKPIPYTIEGLCDVLDCDRDTLLNYEKAENYEEFFGTVKRAKNKIQRNKVERGLMGDSNPAVSIFDLKNNHGYIDKVQNENNSTIEFKGEIIEKTTVGADYKNKLKEASK